MQKLVWHIWKKCLCVSSLRCCKRAVTAALRKTSSYSHTEFLFFLNISKVRFFSFEVVLIYNKCYLEDKGQTL